VTTRREHEQGECRAQAIRSDGGVCSSHDDDDGGDNDGVRGDDETFPEASHGVLGRERFEVWWVARRASRQ